MEGDRILRSILNQTQTSCVVKDVENYLKPIQKLGSKCVDITNLKKYQSFSLKLLRCCIQSFETGKKGLYHLVDACQFAITYLETACSHFVSTKDVGICQLERLIKLLYHFLAYLSRMEDFDRFIWYSKKTLKFCKLEIFLNRNEGLKGSEEEVLTICDKIFEMHWKVASQIANRKSLALNVLSLRMQGLFFLLSASKDIMKFARYFEIALLSFLQEVKNRNFNLEGEVASMFSEILQSVMSYLVTCLNDGVNIKASLTYLILLSFKTALAQTSPKDCLDGLLVAKCDNRQNDSASTLFLPLIEAHRTNILLRKLSGNKLSKELCKQAKKVTKYLCDFTMIHKQLLESKLLLENPKVMIIYDIIRMLFSFPEKLCWEIMVQLIKVTVNLKKHMDSLWKILYDELKNNSGKEILDEKKRKLLYLQWYSFVCWCLQTVETWLGSNEKSTEHTTCSCIAKSQWKKETLFEDCFVLMESASSMLKCMVDNSIDFKKTEYNWIGVAAYNLGIVAQKDIQQRQIIALLQLSILNLKAWVKSGDSDVLVRIHQSSIIAKQKILVGIFLKNGLKEKALFTITDFVLFLLSMDACLEQLRAMIKEQVIFWMKTKETIDYELSSDGVARALSVEIQKISGSTIQSSTLKFIIGCEMTELIDRRSPRSIRDSNYLLDFITAKYTGDDDILVAESIVQCLALQEFELQDRVALCLKAKSLLEQTLAKPDYPSCSEDLLALIYFSLGCCDQMRLLKCSKADGELVNNDEKDNKAFDVFPEIPDYISSFDMAMKIWTYLIKTLAQKKSNCKVEETLKFAHRTSRCLLYMGSLYSLHHQHLKSILAFYLSNLIMTLLDSSTTKDGFDMFATISFESARQLLDLFDFPTAIAVLEDAPAQHEFDQHDSIKLQTAKAIVLTKAGEFQKARNILEALLSADWTNQKTQRSFFQKADALFALALSKESPGSSSTDRDHPLVLAQEALKIFRNLATMLFLSKDNSVGRESHRRTYCQEMQDDKEVSPWIILGRLLDCLLYIVQRYKFQGCLPEARCHIKEALLLCERFGLHERKLEFLIEEADAGLVSHEAEKVECCLRDISTCMRDNFENDCVTSHEDGIDNRSCQSCSDIFLAKSRLRLLLIQRCHALISPNEVNYPELQDNIPESLLNLERNSNAGLEELRRILTAGKGKKRKKVTFDDSAKVSIESELKSSIKSDFLFILTANDISRLLWIEHRIEAHNLNCRAASACQKSSLLKDIDLVLSDLKKLKFFPLICNSYRTSLARLIQNRVWLFLSSEAGLPAINAAWLPSKTENRPNLKGNTDSENSKDSCDAQGTKQNIPPRDKKQKTSRKGSKVKRKAKEPAKVDVDRNEKQLSLRLESEQVIEDLRNMCHEALSYLVPSINCLQIKELYELLSIVTGHLFPIQAAYAEALSFGRSLSQQLLVRNVKKVRKSSKTDEEHGDSHNDLSHVAISMLTEANDTFSFQNHENLKQQVVDDLPKDWRICSIRMPNMGTKCLIATRFQAYRDPIILRIPIADADDHMDEDAAVGGLVRDLASAFVTDPLDEFEEILDQSLRSLETEDVKTWWTNRKKLDKRLQKMLCKMENAWLGGWKGILLGDRKDVNYDLRVKETAEKFCKEIKVKYGLELLKSTIEVLFDSYLLLDRAQVQRAFKTLLGSQFMESMVESFVVLAEQLVEVDSEKEPKHQRVRGRKGRQKEVKTDDVQRSPVILTLDKQLQKVPWESIPMLRNQIVSRMPSLLLTRLSFLNSGKFLTSGVCTESTFYVLNPRNDLQNTQKTFEKWFQSIRGWQGLSGRAPSQAEYRSALEDYDMFIYCGHGNGREFLRGDDIQRINCRALTFLIGCSSGKLLIKGDLDARGMVLHYLIAGCPAIIANLWDVTDKDIDRFLSKALEKWLKEEEVNLLECMPIARDSCLLPYLIGASPVLYGLPVILKSCSSVDVHSK